MELNTFLNLVKSQGAMAGGFLVLLFSLLCFFRRVMNNSQKREDTLMKLLTNHTEEHTQKLALISDNLKKASEEHEKMMELLIRMGERMKYVQR